MKEILVILFLKDVLFMEDIRWIQRFYNYKKALTQLQSAVNLHAERGLTDLEKQGLIQSFEYTHELAWNTLKDYLTEQGIVGLIGSRDTIREAFQKQLILDGELWMETIKSRNKTVHSYDEETAIDISQKIIDFYCELFEQLYRTLFLKLPLEQQQNFGEIV